VPKPIDNVASYSWLIVLRAIFKAISAQVISSVNSKFASLVNEASRGMNELSKLTDVLGNL
jgi:hypothetical protein